MVGKCKCGGTLKTVRENILVVTKRCIVCGHSYKQHKRLPRKGSKEAAIIAVSNKRADILAYHFILGGYKSLADFLKRRSCVSEVLNKGDNNVSITSQAG
jgi:hypothetical protein